MIFRDVDVRNALRDSCLKKFYLDPNSRVLEEFGISLGEVRADIAVVNGALHGYEIKSDADTLRRLPVQIEHYSRVFDYVTIVTGGIHLAEVNRIVPAWWGIQSVSFDKGTLKIKMERKAHKNNSLDGIALAMLLWKNELVQLLKEKGVTKGVENTSKSKLWTLVQNHYSVRELSNSVREKLKIRKSWRSAPSSPENGGYSQLSAK